jgi:HAMP domain-containing protein
MFLFAGVVAAVGVLVLATVYIRVSAALNDQALLLSRVTAANVSDRAAALVRKKNIAGLRDFLRGQTVKLNLAYIVVDDPARKVLAHSFRKLPDEVGNPAVRSTASNQPRLLHIGNYPVQEVSVPILEGRGGSLRLGFWRELIDEEIRMNIMPLMACLSAVILSGVLLAMFLAWRINRPIFRLVAAAKAISTGDLEMPTPNVKERGELGELARSIERLRSSLKAALARVTR